MENFRNQPNSGHVKLLQSFRISTTRGGLRVVRALLEEGSQF